MNDLPKDAAQSGAGRNRNTRPQNNSDQLSSYVFGKVQPQAVPLEEAVLGALMLDREALPIVMDILRPDSFYLESHQLIYRAVIKLFERSNPVDLLTVTEELRKSGELDKVGGGYYLVELTNRVASSANIEYHARIIAQKHIQRELIGVSTKTIKMAYEDTTDVFDLLDEAEKGLFAITQNNLSKTFESMGTLSSKVLKQIEELSEKVDGLTGVPTGFTDLDRLTSGWQPSDLIILAARPGMGKCLAKGTKVLLCNGQSKKVEELLVGELLLGDDSTPRKILNLATGIEPMYRIRQSNGIDYCVNESHILCLLNSNNEVVEISVKAYLELPEASRQNLFGYKTAIELPEKKLPCDPYLYGIFSGGNWFECIHNEKIPVNHPPQTPSSEELSFLNPAQERQTAAPNPNEDLFALPITTPYASNKIPEVYLLNTQKHRRAILAGWMDAAAQIQDNQAELILKNACILPQIKWLCASLGLAVHVRTEYIPSDFSGFSKLAYRLRITGDFKEIPTKIIQIPPFHGTPAQNLCSTICVTPEGPGRYYGFELDGNGRFLLEDLTVSHNTSLILAMALNAAKDFNKGVALFSLEMANTQLVSRLISMEAEIPGSKMRSGKLEDYEWQQLQTTVEKLSQIPVFIDDTPGINIFELRAKCRRLKMQHDIQLIIIDYLQLMTGASENNRNANREQEIAGISRALKGMAKELNVPVIALSQLSRAVEVRGGAKRPQLSDLRESGSIEQDADIVGFIYRPEYYGILEDESGQSLKGIAEVIIAKHRHGALDAVKLKFTDTFAKFGNLDDPAFSGLNDPLSGPFQPSVITRQSRMNDEDIPF